MALIVVSNTLRHGRILIATFASMHVIGRCCMACQLPENRQQALESAKRLVKVILRGDTVCDQLSDS